jgi:hypothetical protein
MKKIHKENLNFHVHFFITFYDHNFPYVVRHFNFKNSVGFAHTRFIFNARTLLILHVLALVFSAFTIWGAGAPRYYWCHPNFKLFPLISKNCIAAMITTSYHGFVSESLVIKAGATCNTPRMIRNISPRSINACFSVKSFKDLRHFINWYCISTKLRTIRGHRFQWFPI